MRGLMLEAVDLPVDYDPDSRAGALMALLQHEIRGITGLAALAANPVTPRAGKTLPAVLGTANAT